MLSTISRTIAEHSLLDGAGGRRLLVAVSGGPDSMALLASLWELAPRLRLDLQVGFVDHGLREAAQAEGEMVAARARVLEIPFHRLAVDVRGARRVSGAGGIQEVARRLRLAALEERARALDCGGVALGHQADDQTETVLFRILRGTGIAGLTGIPYRRGPFIRPLLDVTRAEIIEYLRRRSLSFISDPSNDDPLYARARLRHHVLPILRRENPRVDEALRRLADSAAGRLFKPAHGARGGISVPARIGAQVAEAERRGHGTRTFDLSGSRKIVVTYGRVEIIKAAEDADAGGHGMLSVPAIDVGAPGLFPVGPGAVLVVREYRGEAAPEGDRGWFDGDKIAWPLTLRGRRAGDRMRPRRGAGTRKLADLMIDAKIPRTIRQQLPVVVDSHGNLLFVPGLRPSADAEPAVETRRWIGFEWLQTGIPSGSRGSGAS
jgi:tRNA(Ile)-lysidine synthase